MQPLCFALLVAAAAQEWSARSRRSLKHRKEKPHAANPFLGFNADDPFPAAGACGPSPRNATSTTLEALLANYVDVQTAERRKPRVSGRSVTVVATRHGLGNRLNNVIGGFALALATNRALVVHWPRTDCRRKKRDCDPTSIDDLFDPPPGVSWRRMPGWPKATATMCAGGPFVIANNRQSDVQDVLEMNLTAAAFNGADRPKNWCSVSDRSWAHAVSCNPEFRCRTPTPWFFYGLLQRWLLRPKRSILDQARSVFSGGRVCGVGVHLRKADLSSSSWATADVLEAAYVRALARAGRERGDPDFGVYLAADAESSRTRVRLELAAQKLGAPLLDRATKARPTRSSVRGMQDALAENYVLSSCVEILPRGAGASTFHDLAVARAAFDFGWDQARVDAFTYHAKASDHSLVPSRCPKRKGEGPFACPCAAGEALADTLAAWPGPPHAIPPPYSGY